MHRIYALNHLGQSRLKSDITKNIHKVAKRNRLFTPDLENDQIHVTLRDNLDRNVDPLSSHTTLNGPATRPRNNNIIPNETLITTSPNENNLHTAATRRSLALNGRSEGSKHNLKIPVETEFSDLPLTTAGKQ
jgi:hypothetical protein